MRDDQFVYVESKVADVTDMQDASGYHSTLGPLHTRQIWQSVDGSRAGLLREDGQDVSLGGSRVPSASAPASGTKGPAQTPVHVAGPSMQSPTYRYLESLPTDPAALLHLIYRQTKGEGPGADAEAFTSIGDALREQIAPPAVTAAL